MTEKRFTTDLIDIFDNQTLLDYNCNKIGAEAITELLNELHEEKECLKKALWEAEKTYIYESRDNSIDIEKDMENLKEEFEREAWWDYK